MKSVLLEAKVVKMIIQGHDHVITQSGLARSPPQYINPNAMLY